MGEKCLQVSFAFSQEDTFEVTRARDVVAQYVPGWRFMPLLPKAITDKDWFRLWKADLDQSNGVYICFTEAYKMKAMKKPKAAVRMEAAAIVERATADPTFRIFAMDPSKPGQTENDLRCALTDGIPIDIQRTTWEWFIANCDDHSEEMTRYLEREHPKGNPASSMSQRVLPDSSPATELINGRLCLLSPNGPLFKRDPLKKFVGQYRLNWEGGANIKTIIGNPRHATLLVCSGHDCIVKGSSYFQVYEHGGYLDEHGVIQHVMLAHLEQHEYQPTFVSEADPHSGYMKETPTDHEAIVKSNLNDLRRSGAKKACDSRGDCRTIPGCCVGWSLCDQYTDWYLVAVFISVGGWVCECWSVLMHSEDYSKYVINRFTFHTDTWESCLTLADASDDMKDKKHFYLTGRNLRMETFMEHDTSP